MASLTTRELALACRIFIDLAYPDARAIPLSKLPYRDITPDAPLADYLPPASCAVGVGQDLSKKPGGFVGYEFRLGCATFPHMKLRIQQVELHAEPVWVFSVDTHDGFHHATQFLSPEEASAWRALVDSNRRLKHQIEEALGKAGLLTPTLLLRIDLTSSATPS